MNFSRGPRGPTFFKGRLGPKGYHFFLICLLLRSKLAEFVHMVWPRVHGARFPQVRLAEMAAELGEGRHKACETLRGGKGWRKLSGSRGYFVLGGGGGVLFLVGF